MWARWGSDVTVQHSPRGARALANAEEGPLLCKAVSVQGTCSRRDRGENMNCWPAQRETFIRRVHVRHLVGQPEPPTTHDDKKQLPQQDVCWLHHNRYTVIKLWLFKEIKKASISFLSAYTHPEWPLNKARTHTESYANQMKLKYQHARHEACAENRNANWCNVLTRTSLHWLCWKNRLQSFRRRGEGF